MERTDEGESQRQFIGALQCSRAGEPFDLEFGSDGEPVHSRLMADYRRADRKVDQLAECDGSFSSWLEGEGRLELP